MSNDLKHNNTKHTFDKGISFNNTKLRHSDILIQYSSDETRLIKQLETCVRIPVHEIIKQINIFYIRSKSWKKNRPEFEIMILLHGS